VSLVSQQATKVQFVRFVTLLSPKFGLSRKFCSLDFCARGKVAGCNACFPSNNASIIKKKRYRTYVVTCEKVTCISSPEQV
jgi:hypothetical protein